MSKTSTKAGKKGSLSSKGQQSKKDLSSTLDARRRLEDKLAEMKLEKELKEFDFEYS